MDSEVKRIKLYQDFRADAKANNLLVQFTNKYPNFSKWEEINFANDAAVIGLWNKAIVDIINPASKADFFKVFACDILTNSTYCGGNGKNNNTNNVPPAGANSVPSNTGNPPSTTTTPPTATKPTATNAPVNISSDDVANGNKSVKQGMKGDIVRKIQELLIKHGFTNVSASGKVDGIFGSRTAQSVYDFQQKMGLTTDKIVGENTWAKLIKEPTNEPTGTQPPVKINPNTGLPDNDLGLPKFNTDINRFNKYGVSQAQQDADLKNLKLNENMKLTDIINGIVQEQGTVMPGVGQKFGNMYLPGFPSQTTQQPDQSKLTPNQRLAMNQGFGPVSAEYAEKLAKDGSLKNGANKQTPGGMTLPTTVVSSNRKKAPTLPDGVPSAPSIRDVLNPRKSNLGPVNGNPSAGAPVGKVPAGKTTATAQQQPYSLTDVAKGGYLRFGMKGTVVRDMQVLINSLNVPEIKVDTNGVFNQQTLDAVVKVQKMLGIKPKNGKYGIFGPITIGAINKRKTGSSRDTSDMDTPESLAARDAAQAASSVNTKTGLPNNSLELPKFDTNKNYGGVSKAQQDADLKKLGINEDLIKKTIKKHLRSI
jgi:peptidoglycan hydrolase-like protein with peptidoglycan-binding domain